MRLRDALGEVYQDEQFLDLYPVEGQPVYALWRLVLATTECNEERLEPRYNINQIIH